MLLDHWDKEIKEIRKDVKKLKGMLTDERKVF